MDRRSMGFQPSVGSERIKFQYETFLLILKEFNDVEMSGKLTRKLNGEAKKHPEAFYQHLKRLRKEDLDLYMKACNHVGFAYQAVPEIGHPSWSFHFANHMYTVKIYLEYYLIPSDELRIDIDGDEITEKMKSEAVLPITISDMYFWSLEQFAEAYEILEHIHERVAPQYADFTADMTFAMGNGYVFDSFDDIWQQIKLTYDGVRTVILAARKGEEDIQIDDQYFTMPHDIIGLYYDIYGVFDNPAQAKLYHFLSEYGKYDSKVSGINSFGAFFTLYSLYLNKSRLHILLKHLIPKIKFQ